jgi:YYY domain-containing protein
VNTLLEWLNIQGGAAAILEWFGREGGIVLGWWALVTLAGIAGLPYCLRLLGGLPDRGFTLARVVGVLLVAFLYWLLASTGFLRNTTGSMVFVWALTLGIGIALYVGMGRGGGIDWRAWWRSNRTAIITGEVLFLVMLFAWAVVRAHQNGIVATEKPMEQAFMSAVIRSETFPPNDPWMAGYAISYYYFGYVMSGMLSMLTGIGSGIGFNMTIALLFALTGVTVFGVVYNLVRSRVMQRVQEDGASEGQGVSIFVGLIGVVFVAILGNFQVPLIEVPYQTDPNSTAYLQFIGSNERMEARPDPADSVAEWHFWWWFRAARVLNDRNFDGGREEVIDEFPMFSFLLADNHPHVLALPFAALAVGLMLNVLLRRREFGGIDYLFYAVCLGGLAFLNTWDGPIYTVGVIGALALRRLLVNRDQRLHWNDWVSLVQTGALLFALSFALYLPFWVGFRSQLGGVLPNLIHPTAFQQFFIHFAPFIVILSFYLAVEAWRGGRAFNWRMGIGGGVGLLLILFAAMLIFALAGYISLGVQGAVDERLSQEGFIAWAVDKRLSHSVTALVLTLGIALVIGRMFPRDLYPDDPQRTADPERGAQGAPYPPVTGFALLLIAMGLVLTLTPEFIYLRDNFSTRMNTIFKFYYQAWLLWGIAGAYAVFSLLLDQSAQRQPSLLVRLAFAVVLVAAITGGMLYPILGIHNRTLIETGRLGIENPPSLTLDGGPTTASPDDYAAVMCLGQLVRGDDALVIAGVGNSYDGGHPPSGLTGRLVGIPNLYNWPGHQGQWRGATLGEIAGSRQPDIERLYVDPTWSSARDILLRYEPDFIFYGDFERFRYGTEGEVKFRDRLPIVCEYGNSRFYRVEPSALVE